MSTLKVTTISNSAGSLSAPVDTVVQGTAKAWVNFNGTGVVAIRKAFNVSSITDNGTGDYTVNFAVALPDANYSVATGNGPTNGSSPEGIVVGAGPGLATDVPPTTAGFRCLAIHAGVTLVDMARVTLAIFD